MLCPEVSYPWSWSFTSWRSSLFPWNEIAENKINRVECLSEEVNQTGCLFCFCNSGSSWLSFAALSGISRLDTAGPYQGCRSDAREKPWMCGHVGPPGPNLRKKEQGHWREKCSSRLPSDGPSVTCLRDVCMLLSFTSRKWCSPVSDMGCRGFLLPMFPVLMCLSLKTLCLAESSQI